MSEIIAVTDKSRVPDRIELAFGESKVDLKWPSRYVKVIKSSGQDRELNWEEKIEESFNNPINSPALKEIIKEERPQNIVIIINDITRPVPYEIVLQPMLARLREAGVKSEQITLLIATGMHRPMSAGEIEAALGREIASKYCCINHNCDAGMKHLGLINGDIPLNINPLAVGADFLCAVGVIAPHYMAGFSGGRKSLLPGVCGRDTIAAHHSLIRLPATRTANLTGNRFHLTMLEAAEKANLRFIANIVVDSSNRPVDLVVGDYRCAWEKGVEICRKYSVIQLDRPGDAVVVSAGGFPKDINMYQAQKALENASYCVKEGGPILLVAECREGLGEEVFARWLNEAATPESLQERIKKEFELGGHKAFAVARVARCHPLYLYSSLKKKEALKAFMQPLEDVNQFIRKEISPEDLVYVIPYGANTVPVL